ncbi:hypothetical protein Acr_08g0014010 [Actinidia rufa]|uniref:Uncharacterized protein n=1 Tax=Actinidia rufa TaxID=165716 RepID=A0A7J0F2T4_9ERIC|nr:hypothetical protein Acr_08g0014010 [Actinidia rufa]
MDFGKPLSSAKRLFNILKTTPHFSVRLLPLGIKGRAPLRRLLSSEELSTKLEEGATIARDCDSTEEVVSSSSGSGSTSDDKEKDSNDLGSKQLQPASENEIANRAHEKLRWVLKLKVIGQKKSKALTFSLVPPRLSIIQTPLSVQDLVLSLTVSLKVEGSLSDAPLRDKCKGKNATKGHSKRHKKKGKTSYASFLYPIEQDEL